MKFKFGLVLSQLMCNNPDKLHNINSHIHDLREWLVMKVNTTVL